MMRPLQIVIDARWIFREISGIGLYTQELIRALARLDRENRYVLLFNDPSVRERTAAEVSLAAAPNFQALEISYGLFSPLGQLRLPALLRSLSADVYHSTNYMMPLPGTGRTKRVVTIHDLIPLLFPEFTPRALKTRFFPVFKALMRQVGRRADLIITVSEATRRDVLRELGLPPSRHGRVVAIPEAAHSVYIPAAEPSPAGGEPVILFVGRRDPYKNLPGLVEAFGRLRVQGVSARLRVIGPEDPRYPEARARAEALGLQPHIDWVGYAAPGQLIREYQQAAVFALPSRYEGFGLTVLEARACGAPVICGNASSLPEVAGDAALLVDPLDVDGLAAALRRVLTEPGLAASLRERGLRRAASFSWARTAELTRAAYEQAAALT